MSERISSTPSASSCERHTDSPAHCGTLTIQRRPHASFRCSTCYRIFKVQCTNCFWLQTAFWIFFFSLSWHQSISSRMCSRYRYVGSRICHFPSIPLPQWVKKKKKKSYFQSLFDDVTKFAVSSCVCGCKIWFNKDDKLTIILCFYVLGLAGVKKRTIIAAVQ